MDKETALKNLVETCDNLEKLKLKHFIIDGTLLGAIRERDFIDHDTDIDVGVFMDEWEDGVLIKFEKLMKERGFKFNHIFGEIGKNFEISFVREGIKIDLFFYYKVGGKIRFNAFLNGGKKLPQDLLIYEYPLENFERLETINFLGHKFFTPSEPEKILEIKYGDWKTPIRKWNWATGPKNLISVGKADEDL